MCGRESQNRFCDAFCFAFFRTFAADSLLRRSIAEAGMEDRVVLPGRKDNPYPYINRFGICGW